MRTIKARLKGNSVAINLQLKELEKEQTKGKDRRWENNKY